MLHDTAQFATSTDALGLSLPGNGSTLATHADREKLFLEAGRTIVDLAKRWYEQDDASALPRNIATFAAFENAMSLDIANADHVLELSTDTSPGKPPRRVRSRWYLDRPRAGLV